MCYTISTNYTENEIEKEFNVGFEVEFKASSVLSGFRKKGEYDNKVPIIIDSEPDQVVMGDWGLLPSWSKDRDFQTKTLNAVGEELEIKPSFKNSVNNRCLVLVNGFYEWKWLDPAGKVKEKYFIHLINENKPFALAGIYNIWKDRSNGQDLLTFSICTSVANELMSEIHNNKKRMPIVLDKPARENWLKDKNYKGFIYPTYDPKLEAILI